MITVLCYLLLVYILGSSWSGWLLVLPVLLDLVIIGKLDR